MAQLNRRIGGRKENLREMLLSAGIGEFNATMSLPYMYFLPRTCDPYTQGVIQIVEGLQNLLNARGARVEVDGWMGEHTVKAILPYAGHQWRDKTWMQLYGDVLRGRFAPGFEPGPPGDVDLAGYTEETGLGSLVDDVVDLGSNPLALLAAGAAAYYFFGQKRPNPAPRRRHRGRR